MEETTSREESELERPILPIMLVSVQPPPVFLILSVVVMSKGKRVTGMSSGGVDVGDAVVVDDDDDNHL